MEPIRCSCGKRIRDFWKYCPNCGKKIPKDRKTIIVTDGKTEIKKSANK